MAMQGRSDKVVASAMSLSAILRTRVASLTSAERVGRFGCEDAQFDEAERGFAANWYPPQRN